MTTTTDGLAGIQNLVTSVVSVQPGFTSTTFTTTVGGSAYTVPAYVNIDDSSLYNMNPSFGGNLTFTVLFGLLCIIHIVLGAFYRQRWIGVAFFCGLVLETIGYATRTASYNNYADKDLFLSQIVTLTIAPCFIMGGYYYLLSKIVVLYGKRYSLLSPIAYSYLFISCDIVSLVLQGLGGGVAAVALEGSSETETGTHIMIAGLGFQVLTMSVFLFFWLFFWLRIYLAIKSRGKEEPFDPQYAHIRNNTRFEIFPYVVTVGTLAIFTRCVYRVIELAQGWSGYLITHEKYVFTLDGMMLVISTLILLPPFYPGIVFGRNNHIPVSKSLFKKKKKVLQDELSGDI